MTEDFLWGVLVGVGLVLVLLAIWHEWVLARRRRRGRQREAWDRHAGKTRIGI